MTRFLLLIALAALGGCATTSSDYYRDGRYYGDASRYDDGRYYDDGYYGDRYYEGGYGGGDYYYGSSHGSRYGYASDYLMWPEYYSLFWPINHWYADPYYYPGYYYGVTYFPRDYWSLSLTWGNRHRYGYAYNGYWDYSPYRYSWADNYYDWYPWYRQHSHYHGGYYDRPRYGSARNEAEREMAMRDRDRAGLRSPSYRNAGVRSTAISSPDRRGPRAAYYPSRQDTASARSGAARSSARAVTPARSNARNELIRNASFRRPAQAGKPDRAVSAASAGRTRPLMREPLRRSVSPERRTSTQRTTAYRSLPSRPVTRSERPGQRRGLHGQQSYRDGSQVRRQRAVNADQRVVRGHRDAVYRSAPLPVTRRGAIPAREVSSEPRATRDLPAARSYSRPTPGRSTPTSRYQAAPARATPRSYGGNAYRAPPPAAARSAPAPQRASAGSSRSSASSSKGKGSSSASSRVRGARSARRSHDDD